MEARGAGDWLQLQCRCLFAYQVSSGHACPLLLDGMVDFTPWRAYLGPGLYGQNDTHILVLDSGVIWLSLVLAADTLLGRPHIVQLLLSPMLPHYGAISHLHPGNLHNARRSDWRMRNHTLLRAAMWRHFTAQQQGCMMQGGSPGWVPAEGWAMMESALCCNAQHHAPSPQ